MLDEQECKRPDLSDESLTNVSRRQILKGLTASAVGIGGVSSAEALQPAAAATQTGESTIGPTLIEADEEAGFNFPYMLYAPEAVREKPLVVQTVNSGGCDDDFQVDLDAAQRTAKSGPARQISDSLQVPMIVPVFANPCEGEFYQRFVQTLDTETMRIDEGKFERIDLQMIQMVEDARSRLADEGYDIPAKVMLNGFSASGNFMNNFAILHPERVASVTAGAINGMAILPRESVAGQETNFMIGVADLETLIGEEFNKEAWQETPQFCYMGETESPPQDDTLPYRDVWSKEQAALARVIYGDNMQTERMTFSEWQYHKAGSPSRFEVYDGIGHTYNREIIQEVIEFHRRHNDIPKAANSEPGAAQFVTEPQAGDTSVEVSYSWPADTSEKFAALSIVPDGESKYWERRIRLATPGQGEQDTSTFDLSTSKEGVPFEAGDEVQLWLIPNGNQTPRRATVIQKVTIGSGTESGSGNRGGERTGLSASTCDEELDHPNIEIGFAERPTVGEQEVAVSYDIGDGFSERARTRLFPETGGGKWGLGLDRIEPGKSGQETYSIDTTLQLGETAELRVFPVSWSQLDDVEATNCAVVSGVQFTETPTAGSPTVSVEYLHPKDASAEAELELTVDSEAVDTVSGISPGTFEEYTFSVDGFDDGVPGEAEVKVTLRPIGSSESIDSTVYRTRQADAGTVSFARQPGDGDESVTLEYSLASGADVGQFAALRMYHGESSSWGIYLGDVANGDEATESFEIIPDEPGIPLSEGTELEVSLVAGDDPYRTSPLSTATATVGAESSSNPETQPETQPLQLRVREPADGEAVPSTENLGITAEIVNENSESAETTVIVEFADRLLERTVTVPDQTSQEIEFVIPNSALSEGMEATLVVHGEKMESEVKRSVTVEASDSSDESTETADDSDEGTGGTAGDESGTSGGETSGTESDSASTESENDESDESQNADDSGPGFGLIEALTGLGGIGYMLKERFPRDNPNGKEDHP